MSIRLRIVVLTTALMAVVLAAIGAGVYLMLARSLDSQVSTHLQSVYGSIVNDSHLLISFETGATLQLPRGVDMLTQPGLYLQIQDVNGNVVSFAPGRLSGSGLNVPSGILKTNQTGRTVTYNSSINGAPVRIISGPLIDQQFHHFWGTVQVVESLSPMLHTLSVLRLLLLTAAGLGTVFTAIAAYLLADRSLRPLARITATAQGIGTRGDLSQRIEPPHSRDEVQQLAETFNDMMDRLEDTFNAERRFVSDASHELRTPLTALRGNAEILLRQIDAGRIDLVDLREGLGDIRDEAERMGRLVRDLLTLARADVGWRAEMGQVHLDQVVADAARVAQPLAGDHQFEVQVDGEVDVVGNPDQLKQLLLILLDNAFTYTPPGGRIELSVRELGVEAEIAVRDNGPGIPPEQLPRVFDRFYRGDVARTHGNLGAGLGLAIARWIVDCHRGSIRAESAPGEGTTVIVRLPLDATANRPAPPSMRREVAAALPGD
ncbi:MAG TPA: ATP-binding protein [Thermomicrobiaceae bacterium]|nr:ATP-binding protein [Thermomicrobiaceae bacterium]